MELPEPLFTKMREVESPVLGVTTANLSPDRAFSLAAIAANSRSGATSPASAIYVGDDGGYNALSFGDASSDNYFASVDMFCPNYASVAGAGASFTRMGIAIRANYNVVPSIDGPSIVTYPQGNYALVYESSATTVFAVKFGVMTTGAEARAVSLNVNTTTFQVFAKKAITDNGWHTLKIGASGSTLKFLVDGIELATVSDSAYPRGEAVLYYRAYSTFDGVAATDTQGVFDNMIAGPFSIPTGIDSWEIME
jgi:hypothetical protein